MTDLIHEHQRKKVPESPNGCPVTVYAGRTFGQVPCILLPGHVVDHVAEVRWAGPEPRGDA